MNIQTRSWQLSRRTFLRGVGASVALPLLEAMLPASRAAAATAAATTGGPKAKRMVCIYTPNGCNIGQWTPKSDGAAYEISPILKPLEPMRGDVTVLSGLFHRDSVGGHEGADTWLTGANLRGTPGYEYRNSVSADQLAAEAQAKWTRFGSLELSTNGGTGAHGHMTTLAWTRNAVPLPAESKPRTVFDRLFAPDTQTTLEARKQENRRQKTLLDAVLQSARALDARLGRADQEKLDEYLTSVNELEKRIVRSESWLAVPKPTVDGKPFETNAPTSQVKAYLRMMYDLITVALQTDSTRVVTFETGIEAGGFNFKEIGISQGHHTLSHYDGDMDLLAKLGQCDTYLIEQYAWFLDRLRSTKEADGTSLLDRTMVLYGSGMSIGHSKYNLPTLLAGGKALGLNHGRHLDLSKGGAPVKKGDGKPTDYLVNDRQARLSNLLVTMLQKMDVPAATFADSTGTIGDLAKT